MNLQLPVDDIWNKEIHPKHRNKIRIAENRSLKYAVDEKLEHLDSFMRIYNERMEVLGADDFYFFNKPYYAALKNKLKERSFLGIIYLGDKIISAAIFLNFGIYGHYHLAASLENYLPYRPNNFLIYQTALYLKEKGIKIFHLGGGLSGDQKDDLYNFKKRFSKTEYDFYIGKIIFDQDIYSRICKKWENKFPDKRKRYEKILLKYRY